MRKPFDQKLHNENDKRARETSKKYIKKLGFTAVDNQDIYGPDLIVEGLCYVECEIKKYWRTNHYPYEQVRLPFRKKKFAILDMPIVFYIWNDTCTTAIRIRGSQLCSAEVKEYQNSKVPKGEMFFWFNTKDLEIIKL